ncbi:SAM-dependent methyltransferase [Streptomyces sp. SCSIO ZS0520]|uniref:SAM-dependent methyltransferase n=1 Tax=Streptomyces sp. SCSIO ZS0520 TaxID=2892996 RepID=UPI0021DB1AC2|nr:SAM-dependent methyltransferase [Streptomyces sp. SCSIO ZS0520]
MAVHGGDITLPDGRTVYHPGLLGRLGEYGLGGRVTVVEGDFLDTAARLASCDAVWTSCSWHYSANQARPLPLFLGRMQDLVCATGLFGAEFFMPLASRHRSVEHYTSPERLMRHFAPSAWQILLTLRTGIFTEHPHIDHPHEHEHRMGFLLAARNGAAH